MASTVRDIMTTKFEWIADGDSVLVAGARLIELGFGAMPVRGDAGSFRGMLTMRDIVRVMTQGEDPARVTAGEVADASFSVDAGESLDQALAQLTDGKAGRLPVVDGPELVGVITRTDIATHRRTMRELGPAAGRLVEEISPDDEMYGRGGRASYLWTGVAALQPIKVALAAAGRESVENVLDFASGHGRVLRALKAEFPHAHLTACDLDRDAVDFCARTFGASPVYSHEDPARIEIDDRFDLIWCGSLFTHIDAPRWAGFLDLLGSLLSPGGVLVITTAGRSVAAEMREGEYRGLTADLGRGLLEDFDRTGFGYRDYPGQSGYGLARCRPAWVCEQLERRTGFELLGYTERGWNRRQDTVACIRRP
jgi:CBS domain-containing protein/SAM-dependent methyltransferase